MSPRVYAVIMILLMGITTHGQEQLGMRTSNYAGVNGLTLNPASSLTNPLPWDANLFEFGTFFDNNYLYLENFRLLDASHVPSQVALRPELDYDHLPTPNNKLIVGFYRNTKSPRFSYRADLMAQAMGPSLMLRLDKNSVVGIYTRARGVFNARKLPGVLGYYEFTEKLYNSEFTVKPFKVDGMAWTELGFNYARSHKTDFGNMSIGGTIKWLHGYEFGYGSMEQSMRFIELPDNRLLGAEGQTKHGFTIPIIRNNRPVLTPKGGGLGMDVGVTFTIKEGTSYCQPDKRRKEHGYRYKVGFSLLDVGYVRFTRATENHMVVVTDSTSLYFDEFSQFSSVTQLDTIARVFSKQTMKNPYTSFQGHSFTMWLPAAISAQAEVAVSPSIFLNATIVQGVPLLKNRLRRGTVIGFTPRFESRWLEAALPFTVLNGRKLRSGLTARLGFFWIGTEDLGSIVNRSKFDSTDIYFALKANPIELPFGKLKKRPSTNCPSF